MADLTTGSPALQISLLNYFPNMHTSCVTFYICRTKYNTLATIRWTNLTRM